MARPPSRLTRSQRVLAALWLLAGLQAAVWSIDYAVRRVRRSLRITEGRFHR